MSERLARLMDGCDRIVWRGWPGAPEITIGVRTISDREWSQIADEARASVHGASERERDYLANKATRRAVIGRCIVVRDGVDVRPLLTSADLDLLDTEIASDLFASIVRARDEAHGSDEWARQSEVFAELERAYKRTRVRGVAMRLRAKFAGLCGFYGVTDARLLTDWQVLLYARLVREEDE